MHGPTVGGTHAHNLRTQLSTFVGREQEIAEVVEILGTARLLTLTGAGGAGKTRLARQVAASLVGTFPHGAWIVELAALADPALVSWAVASALGLPETPDRPVGETLQAFLGPRTLLLVLDNCEHLIDACADLVERLLSGCPDLRILTTSRELLRLGGEVMWRVPSLAVPDLQRLPREPAELARYAAVRLFDERARAVRSEFRLTPQNAAAVARVCARLDGLPLALELAAARVRVLTPEQIAMRLDDSFALLTGGSRTAPTRQQTLEATLDWSFRLLSVPESALFRRLAVFAGGFDVRAAEAVGAGDGIEPGGVLDLLARLVDKSLVLADERGGLMRYRLLEPIRQYAHERLATSGERNAIERRHGEYYIALAEEAEPQLLGPEQTVWFSRLEREHDNLRAALAWTQADASGTEWGLRLAATLGWFWTHHGYWSEARGWFDRVLADSQMAIAPRARVLASAGTLVRWQGDYDRAETLFGEGLDLSRKLSDHRTTALIHVHLGHLFLSRGDTARAKAFQEQGVALSRDVGDLWLVAFSLEMLGEVLRWEGEFERAAAAYSESLALCRSIGDARGMATTLADLAHLALQQGDGGQAAALLAESLALALELGDERRVVMAIEGLAGAVVREGGAARAVRLFGAAQAWRSARGVPREPADRKAYARDVASATAALGSAGFEAGIAEGRDLSLDQAAALAWSTDPSPRVKDASTETRAAWLLVTRREREVAGLVAEGLTNRQIAQRLVISERTADNHVANILGKLGLSTRAQVAVWAAQNELLADADPARDT